MMASIVHSKSREGLDDIEIHDVLSNERRRMTLQLLSEAGESLTARKLSERIAEWETGESPPPRNIRQSAYISLHQTHLPKLDDLDVVEYDDATKKVRLSSSARDITNFIDSDKRQTVDRCYLVISVAGLFVIGVSWLGVSSIDPVVATIIAGSLFGISGCLAAYRMITGSFFQ